MILMRHGQSHFNVHYARTRTDPGIEDPGLTPEGEQQAVEAAALLADFELARIISSPYQRTLRTAHIVADALGLPVSVQAVVREHAFFTCDIGTPASHLNDRWPHFDFGELPEIWWPDLGETEDQVLVRCDEFRQYAAALPDWERLLVVTHWGFIRGLTGEEVANAALRRFDPTGKGPTTVVVGEAP